MCFCNCSLCDSTAQYSRTCLVFSSGNGVVLKRCGYVWFRKTFICSLQINVYIKYALKILDLVYVSLLHSFFSLSHSHSLSLFCSPYPIISPIMSPLSPILYILIQAHYNTYPNGVHNNVTCVLTHGKHCYIWTDKLYQGWTLLLVY